MLTQCSAVAGRIAAMAAGEEHDRPGHHHGLRAGEWQAQGGRQDCGVQPEWACGVTHQGPEDAAGGEVLG